MDNKAQTMMQKLAMTIPFVIMMYVILVVLNPMYNDLLFPLLGNFVFGDVVITLFQTVPLLLGVLWIMFLVAPTDTPRERTQQF